MMWNIIKNLVARWNSPKFRPGVFYNEDLKLTEIVLEDTMIVWCPWGPYIGHAVDCGYSSDGRLVGIKIWDDVRDPKRINWSRNSYGVQK
jgi:hypothetical protein